MCLMSDPGGLRELRTLLVSVRAGNREGERVILSTREQGGVVSVTTRAVSSEWVYKGISGMIPNLCCPKLKFYKIKDNLTTFGLKIVLLSIKGHRIWDDSQALCVVKLQLKSKHFHGWPESRGQGIFVSVNLSSRATRGLKRQARLKILARGEFPMSGGIALLSHSL